MKPYAILAAILLAGCSNEAGIEVRSTFFGSETKVFCPRLKIEGPNDPNW